jgi:hypothetical protein
VAHSESNGERDWDFADETRAHKVMPILGASTERYERYGTAKLAMDTGRHY